CHSYFFFVLRRPPPRPALFPYTTLFRSPCVISASMLFCVDTRGVDSSRPCPVSSSADSATSRLMAPLMEPTARPTVELAVDSPRDRKSTRLNSSHVKISYAVFCLKKKSK